MRWLCRLRPFRIGRPHRSETLNKGNSAVHTLGNRFEKLIAEAERQPFEGWNFSYGKDRIVEEPLPWNYLAKVRERLSGVSALLNLGTGGGEVFAQLEPFPQRTFATEEFAPNAPIAARRHIRWVRKSFATKRLWRTTRSLGIQDRTGPRCRFAMASSIS